MQSMEAPAPTTCDLGLGGAMLHKLPGRLDGLLYQGYILPNGVEKEISLIKSVLEEIIDILSDLEDSHASRCWRKEVRELSYDIDDFIDQYEHTNSGSLSRSHVRRTPRWRHRIKTTLHWLNTKLKQRLWMANKIREFSLRTQEALQRHNIFKLGCSTGTALSSSRSADASSSSFYPSPRLCDSYNVLIGIDDPMGKLEEWLTIMNHEEQHKLNVMSIVGFGGIGKTTLATELYRKLGPHFECRAFVRSSKKNDIRKLLISMLSQLGSHQPFGNCMLHSIISSIRTHLEDKRYLIIIDDLWASSTWDIVKSALPEGDRRSRVLTTTEIEELALQSCGYDSKYVFMMQPLGKDDSRSLFFRSIFCSQHDFPPDLREILYDIIRKCGGLPLAIVTIAGVLVSQLSIEHCNHVNKSISYSLVSNPTLDGMKQLLNVSYNNLPQYLRDCMLYMSIYQEGTIILKEDIVNQWIAEGFIYATELQDKQEISRAYFDELVGRKMIQPVHINKNGVVISFLVHHMVRNLVTSCKSMEENFVTAIHYSQATTTLADKVRRLSLQYGNTEDAIPPNNMRLSQVRTLAFFGVLRSMPSILELRLLQVLILHLWGDNDCIRLDLTKLSELFRLKYLKVTSNVSLEIQTQMRGLQHLETIKIGARISVVPSEITHLQGLLHLSLPAETDLPIGIGHMTSLRTLGYFDISSNSMENVQSLSKLTNLVDLQVTCSRTTIQHENLKDKMQFLLNSIIGRFSNLKYLTVAPRASTYANSFGDTGVTSMNPIDDTGATSMTISDDFSSVLSCAPTLLESLEFSSQLCIFSRIPKLIGRLRKICVLKIGVSKIERDCIAVLRGLPALAVLSLYVHCKPVEKIVIEKEGFLVLAYLKFKCCDSCLKFEVDALPNLQKLKLGFNLCGTIRENIPIGIKHLSSLKEISAIIGGVDPKEFHRKNAEKEFRDSIRVHVKCERVNIRCVKQMVGGMEDHNNLMGQEKCKTLKQYKMKDEEDSDIHDQIMQEYSSEEVNENDDNRFTLSEQQILLILGNKLDDQHDNITRGIPVVDVYSNDPWKLTDIGGREGGPLLYFSPLQEARSIIPIQTLTGYWKDVGLLPECIYSAAGLPIGMKRTMEFYHGHVTSGTRTNWKITEFITFANAYTKPRDELVLCQLYAESTTNPAGSAGPIPAGQQQQEGQQTTYLKQKFSRPAAATRTQNLWGDILADIRKLEAAEKMERMSSCASIADDGFTFTSMPLYTCKRSNTGIDHARGTCRKRPSLLWTTEVTGSADDDGHWRKYFQKEIPGTKHPRRLETAPRMERMPSFTSITEDGFTFSSTPDNTCNQLPGQVHPSNQRPGAAASSAEAQKRSPLSSLSLPYLSSCFVTGTPVVSSLPSDTNSNRPCKSMLKSRRSEQKVTRIMADLDDGYSWRKYGQKDILGAKHPRTYYRCMHRHSAAGCSAKKQVQRKDEDPQLFDVVYHGEHTCAQIKQSTNQSSIVSSGATTISIPSTTRDDRQPRADTVWEIPPTQPSTPTMKASPKPPL